MLTAPFSQPPNVESIEDALANLAAPETVQDYATAGGRRVDATKQLCLEHLPPVLILHLKRFSYNNVGGTVKNHKIVGFETELRISPSILAPSQKSSGPIEYKLNAGTFLLFAYVLQSHSSKPFCRSVQSSITTVDQLRAATTLWRCANRTTDGST